MGADGVAPSFNSSLQPHLMHDLGHCDDMFVDPPLTPLMSKVQEQALEAIVRWMQDWKPTSS